MLATKNLVFSLLTAVLAARSGCPYLVFGGDFLRWFIDVDDVIATARQR